MQLPGRRINGNETLHTPWFSRGGDSMLLRIETLKAVGSGALSVTVETKSMDEATAPGDGSGKMSPASGGTSIALATSGFTTGLYLSNAGGTAGTKDQVRLKFTWSGASDSDYFDVRVLAPVFFDAAK